MYLVAPDRMREMDRRTIEEVGIAGPILMDRAARGAVEVLLDVFSPPSGSPIGFLCGTGNNGGDGLAMATLLAHRGYEPKVIVLGGRDRLSDDARLYFDIAHKTVESVVVADDTEKLEQELLAAPYCAVWCDALLGTGLDRPLGGRYARAVEFLDTQTSPVFAVDIPTGLDGLRGKVLGSAAVADATATFGFAKIGQCLDPARSYCGHLVVVDIGIPDSVRRAVGADAIGIDRSWVVENTPQRARDIHKGTAGKTLHIGGRPDTAGAIALSARAALLGGAGLITVATDAAVQPMIPGATPEIMARAAFASGSGEVYEEVLAEAVDRADTVVVGPGLGTDSLSKRVMEIVVDKTPSRLVVDADGLNLLSMDDELREKLVDLSRTAAVVLTPHPGEAARLLDATIDEVLDDTVESARHLSRKFEATVVLKTAATVITDPPGSTAINRSGNPGMATGGMGDALTGLIAAAFADQGENSFAASCQGVAVHGLAGDEAAEKCGHRGLTVQHLLDALPAVWQSMKR